MAHRRIHNKGDYRLEEAEAGGAITPGMLIKVNSEGKVVVHTTEGGFAENAFAAEDQLQGNTISDAYSSGDIVTYLLPYKGSSINALLKAGQDVNKGDALISNGDGTLKAESDASSGTDVKQIVAYAEEALDLSGSGAVNTLVAARVA